MHGCMHDMYVYIYVYMYACIYASRHWIWNGLGQTPLSNYMPNIKENLISRFQAIYKKGHFGPSLPEWVFKNLSLFIPYGSITSCKISGKNNKPTHRQDTGHFIGLSSQLAGDPKIMHTLTDAPSRTKL